MARGDVVTYDNLIISLGLPNKTPVNKRQSKISIGASVRDLRRRFGINSNNSKNANPFITTGKGIKLAFLTKLNYSTSEVDISFLGRFGKSDLSGKSA